MELDPILFLSKSKCSWIWKKCLNQNQSRNLKFCAQTCTWKTFWNVNIKIRCSFKKEKMNSIVSFKICWMFNWICKRTIGFSFLIISLSKMYPFILRIKELSILVVWKTLKNHQFSQMNKQWIGIFMAILFHYFQKK
jgi:hypothetical protein